MASGTVVVLFPAKRSLAARFGEALCEVAREVIAFERTHARLAWSVTLVGLAVGLVLQHL